MNEKEKGFMFSLISEEQVKRQSLKQLHVCSPAGQKVSEI